MKGIVEEFTVETRPEDDLLETCARQILIGKRYSLETMKDIEAHPPTVVSDTQWSELWRWIMQYV